MTEQKSARYILMVKCPDQSGLIAAITNCIAECGGNIFSLAQHTSIDVGTFFCRIAFSPIEMITEKNHKFFNEENFSKNDSKNFCKNENLKTEKNKIVFFSPAVFTAKFSEIVAQYKIEWKIFDANVKQRMAVLVSKTSHCLYELLLKQRAAQLDCEIPLVISNHRDLQNVAKEFGVPFFFVDYQNESKIECESKIQKLLEEYKIEVVCLARYMQILSAEFTNRWQNKIINIHHGFLPAFKGAKPYNQAWNKGVKLIGATAHFANEDLDQGPIIYQDVVRVSDTNSIKEFTQIGQDVERRVLVEALRLFFNHSVFIHSGRTFVIE